MHMYRLLHLAQDKHSDANPSYLLEQGANPNAWDPFHHKWTPLHYAVFLNKENFALQLLQHPRTNAQLHDSDGFSPLYWAAKKSTPKVIKALLSKGCDPNQRDMHGMTALFAAVAANNPDNVKVLLAHPTINVNQPNQFGGSALHHTGTNHHQSALLYPVYYHVSLIYSLTRCNSVCCHSIRIVYTAFTTDNVDIAKLLVKAGANLFLYDYEDQAPLHVAKRRKRKKLFQYFKSKMKEEEPSWKCDVDTSGWDSLTELTEDTDTLSEPSMNVADIAYPPISIPALNCCKDTELKPASTTNLTNISSASNKRLNSLTPPASVTQNVTASPVNAAQFAPQNDNNNNNNLILPPHDNLQLPPAVNSSNASLDMNATSLQSNPSLCSHFSQQSSNSSNDEAPAHCLPAQADRAQSNPLKASHSVRLTPTHQPSMSQQFVEHRRHPPRPQQQPSKQQHTPVLTPSHAQSVSTSTTPKISQNSQAHSSRKKSQNAPPSPSPSTNSQHAWHKQQQLRMKQIQESKLRMALKIEQSNLSKEARDLLQEQQYQFEFEQRFFYDTMMHEYEHLRFQLKHQNEVIKQLLAENNQFKVALRYYKNDGRSSSATPRFEAKRSNQNVPSAPTPAKISRQRKEFKRWFRKQIGEELVEQYFDLFVDAGFDDLRSIMHIHNEQDLINLGISKPGHVRRIFAVIESYQLQNTQDIAPPALQPSASSPVNKSVSQQQQQHNDLQYYHNFDDPEGQLRTE